MVLLLYTSHNPPLIKAQPSFIWKMTFPLGSANFLLLLCELWRWGMSIVNQHNNIRSISSAGTSESLGRGKAVHQMTAHPELTHTEREQVPHTQTISPALFYSHPLSYRDKHTKIQRSDRVWIQRRRKKKRQNLAKGIVSVSSSSTDSGFHQRYLRPIRLSCQSGISFSPQTAPGLLKGSKLPLLCLTVFINFSSGLNLRLVQV